MRRNLSIEERNALERYAIGRGKAVGFDKRGTMLVGYVEGFMAAVTLTPTERSAALAGLTKTRRVKQLSLVDSAEGKAKS